MTATQRTIARARFRLSMHQTVRLLGWSIVIASAVAVAGLVGTQWFGIALPWWSFAILGGVALAASVAIAVARRPSSDHVAVMVDDRLKLKDKLGTSLYASRLDDSPLTRHIIDDAERSAAGLPLGEAFPVRPTKVWGWALAAVALVCLVAIDPFGLEARAHQIAQEKQLAAEETKQIEEALQKAKEEAKQVAEERKPEDDPAAVDPIDLEEQLEAMLTERDLSNPEDRREAAAEVSDLQEKFSEAVEQQKAAVQAMQNTMSGLESAEPGPADPFADALRRGDFDEAQNELAKLADQIEQGDMSEQQKEQLSNQLQELSQQLAEAAQQQQDNAQQAQQQAQQAMQNAGLSQEQMDQLAQDGFDPKAVQQAMQQALQDAGMSQQQAQQQSQQMSQQMQQAMQNAQNAQSAGDAAQQLSQQMQQMSQSLQQQGMQNSQLAQSLQQMQQQLSQCAGQQGDMQNMQNAQQQLQQALQKLAGDGSNNQPPQGGQGQGQGQNGMAGTGSGPGDGYGSGGAMLGDQRPDANTPAHAAADIQQGNGGRVIASWTRDGQMAKGEAKLSFDQAVTDAKADAERAISEDRTPKRYHNAIKEYFGNLPDEPSE